MDPAATSSPRTGDRIWHFWLSIAAQQIVFVLAYNLRIPLLGISEWVIFVPVGIIWGLYAVVPLFTPKREMKHALLRAYALTGWVFVLAAVSWSACYISLSKKYGTPVSYDEMQKMNHWLDNPTAPPVPPAGQPPQKR
jgi:hypothetical protein